MSRSKWTGSCHCCYRNSISSSMGRSLGSSIVPMVSIHVQSAWLGHHGHRNGTLGRVIPYLVCQGVWIKLVSAFEVSYL